MTLITACLLYCASDFNTMNGKGITTNGKSITIKHHHGRQQESLRPTQEFERSHSCTHELTSLCRHSPVYTLLKLIEHGPSVQAPANRVCLIPYPSESLRHHRFLTLAVCPNAHLERCKRAKDFQFITSHLFRPLHHKSQSS